MMKTLRNALIAMLFSSSLLALDASFEILNEQASLPKLKIVDKSPQSPTKARFYNAVKNDLEVSASFELVEENPDYIFEYNYDHFTVSARISSQINELHSFNANINAIPGAEVFLAHTLIAELGRRMGLEDLSWMTQKVIFAKQTGKKHSQIVVADYTLAWEQVLLKGGLNLFPKWANKEQTAFYYTDLLTPLPSVMKYDVKSGAKSKILSSQGMAIVSDVNANGTELLITMAPKDQADVYKYNLLTKQLSQISNYPGIDVAGQFVDDGRVAFVSDRLGYPNLFIKDARGVSQLVYHGKNNSAMSVNGDYIVYSSRDASGGSFNLYLMSLRSDFVRALTASGKNIFPIFSQNGNTIMFIKLLGGQSSLGILRINQNKVFFFPQRGGKIQAMDW